MKLFQWRRRQEEALNAEIQSHLDEAVRARMERGESAEQALANARQEFGNMGLVKEITRGMWGWASLERLEQDFRFVLRMLRKNPGFSIVAILTLSLGIGANTAIFSVINAALLRPLPYIDVERIVAIGSTQKADRRVFGNLSYPDFADFQAQTRAFAQMAVYQSRIYLMAGDDGAVRVRGAIVSSELFPILGVQPLLGRAFLPNEDKAGGGHAVVLSYQAWLNRFQGDAQIIGKAITFNGQSHTVVGVTPPGFQFPVEAEPVELWANFTSDAESTGGEPHSAQRGSHYLSAIGKLKAGVTVTQAEVQLVDIAARLEQEHPNTNHGVSVRTSPLLDKVTNGVRDSLWVIFAAVGCVLLIACANVANLLLARAANRRREIAVRIALGAGRWRVMRQLLTESLLLAMLGGGLGVLLATLGTRALLAITPGDIPRMAEARVDYRVLLFSLLIASTTGLVMGLVPAWQAAKQDVQAALKEGGRNAAGGRASIRNTLVIAEVALAVVLLVGAGLLLNSFVRLLRVHPGFNPQAILTMRIGLPDAAYGKAEDIASFHDRLFASLEGAPGVAAYSTATPLPLTNANLGVGFSVEGRPKDAGRDFPYETRVAVVGAGYLHALGATLLQGREFSVRDGVKAPQVALINEAFARKFFSHENPIGKRINPAISADDGPIPMREIVGVVANIKSKNLSETASPEVYLHFPQCPAFWSFSLVFRTAQDPQALATLVREKVNQLDRNVLLAPPRALDSYVSDIVAQPRFNSALLSLFAGLALLLTSLGLYGVVSYTVTQRMPELGIRMALGAQAGDILRMVIWRGMRLTFVGVMLGVAAALALTRVLKNLLFEVSATDPASFAAPVLLLIIIALVASYIPARRATKVDPLQALLHE
jgi:putative ABC transport system permease protein